MLKISVNLMTVVELMIIILTIENCCWMLWYSIVKWDGKGKQKLTILHLIPIRRSGCYWWWAVPKTFPPIRSYKWQNILVNLLLQNTKIWKIWQTAVNFLFACLCLKTFALKEQTVIRTLRHLHNKPLISY